MTRVPQLAAAAVVALYLLWWWWWLPVCCDGLVFAVVVVRRSSALVTRVFWSLYLLWLLVFSVMVAVSAAWCSRGGCHGAVVKAVAVAVAAPAQPRITPSIPRDIMK